MLWFIMIRILLSLIVVYLLHSLYNYLKDTLTVRKTKDLVSLHKEKYQEILEELRQVKETASPYSIPPNTNIDQEDALFLETSLEKLIESI